MARIPPADTPIIDKGTGRISLEWYTALQRIISEIATFGSGGVASFEGRSGIVTSQSGDYTASEITNVPAGNISAVTVQAAINELDTEKQPVDGTLTALAAYNTNGLIAQTAADTFAGRTLTGPANGVSVSNGDGVAGNPTIALANDLASLEAMAGTGLVARTAAETYAQRTVTGTAGQISVANGDGVSGDPTLSLPADVLIPAIITAPNTGLHLLDTNASHDLIIAPGSNLTADRTLTVTTGDTNITLDLTDPGADRLMFWDESASLWRDLTLGTGLSITGTTIESTGGGSGGITIGTAQNSTSGSTIDFNSLPSGINRIMILFSGVSLSGTNDIVVQLGDSGGIENTGYLSSSGGISGSNTCSISTSAAGFTIRGGNAGRALSGHMLITRITGNTWVASHALGSNASNIAISGGGNKSLSADLDRVRITVETADTFDAGQINIYYETS